VALAIIPPISVDEMAPTGPPTEQEIWTIARRTTDIIESNITSDVCVFGGAASSLWANIGRVPNVGVPPPSHAVLSFPTKTQNHEHPGH
jgi:hypothetical protein